MHVPPQTGYNNIVERQPDRRFVSQIRRSSMRIPWRIGILLWTLCISTLTQITAAQEIPADYQQVLKIVAKSGDYKSKPKVKAATTS